MNYVHRTSDLLETMECKIRKKTPEKEDEWFQWKRRTNGFKGAEQMEEDDGKGRPEDTVIAC